jgi:hypothetical protein
MANPFASQSSSSGMDAMMPLMMMSMMGQNSAPTPAAPAKAPTMSPGTFKNPSVGSSFAGAPAPAPMQNQLGGKTLLGQ